MPPNNQVKEAGEIKTQLRQNPEKVNYLFIIYILFRVRTPENQISFAE